MKLPRMSLWLVASLWLALVIWLLAPQQLPVSVYKLSLITMAAWVGYWIDRGLFPYARPHEYLEDLNDELVKSYINGCIPIPPRVQRGMEIPFAATLLRRAIIIAAVVVAVALGA